jgi:serine/threonine protein kinase
LRKLENDLFAIKKLLSDSIEAFKREAGALHLFSGNVNPNVISLLATWTQNGEHFLLFPWAKSDLQQFWMNEAPNMTAALVRWVSKQCLGLADGLVSIHIYTGNKPHRNNGDAVFGRHSDIKPENILLFGDPDDPIGRLTISDLGLADFRTRENRSNIPNEKIERTPTYRPPERDIVGKTVSRSWDIWSFGCLLLEFSTWMLGGFELVQQFNRYRLKAHIWGDEIKTDVFFSFIATTDGRSKIAIVKPEVTKVSASCYWPLDQF